MSWSPRRAVQAISRWWHAPGRGMALAVLALALAAYAVNPAPLRELRARGFDMAQHLWPLAPDDTLIHVHIVGIDEESLKRLGQWPWPRDLVADLVRRIAAGKPAALGVDILFPEEDRYSPPLLARTLRDLPPATAEALARLPSTEDRLAAAFAEVPTVLSAGPSYEPPAPTDAPYRVTLIRQIGDDPRPYLTAYKSMIRTLPEISRTARSEAAITDESDPDGVVRAVPLLTLVQSRLIPAFALEVSRIAAGFSSTVVTTGAAGIKSVAIGPLSIPTDGRGRAYLHFGPRRARYESAATVLDSTFDPSEFKGQIVLIGVTGLGILDEKTTPFGLVQGIDVHAQLIESIISGTLLRRPASVRWIELALILLAGAAVIGLVRYDSPRVATGAALGIAGVLLGGEFALFGFAGWLVDGIYPAGIALVTFGSMLGGHLRVTQAARRRLAKELEHERELTARLEGELTAARAIQMGLLPHIFPAFPERSDIDLYARIEPARAVGGDLYDYLMIDANRLFFIIADVSGKGIPAALFMAMTKEIVRDAVQRHGGELDRVLAEVNAKTAAASSEMDMMFVTAFAGVLDLVSGVLLYASAGHDRPFLLRDRSGLRQLETEGGPPLGVVEDYLFPIERDRLEGNTVLLLYTDGVTEAQDSGGGLYSSARLSAALAGTHGQSAKNVVDFCFDAVRGFVGSAEQADDITVLAIRRTAARLSEP